MNTRDDEIAKKANEITESDIAFFSKIAKNPSLLASTSHLQATISNHTIVGASVASDLMDTDKYKTIDNFEMWIDIAYHMAMEAQVRNYHSAMIILDILKSSENQIVNSFKESGGDIKSLISDDKISDKYVYLKENLFSEYNNYEILRSISNDPKVPSVPAAKVYLEEVRLIQNDPTKSIIEKEIERKNAIAPLLNITSAQILMDQQKNAAIATAHVSTTAHLMDQISHQHPTTTAAHSSNVTQPKLKDVDTFAADLSYFRVMLPNNVLNQNDLDTLEEGANHVDKILFKLNKVPPELVTKEEMAKFNDLKTSLMSFSLITDIHTKEILRHYHAMRAEEMIAASKEKYGESHDSTFLLEQLEEEIKDDKTTLERFEEINKTLNELEGMLKEKPESRLKEKSPTLDLKSKINQTRIAQDRRIEDSILEASNPEKNPQNKKGKLKTAKEKIKKTFAKPTKPIDNTKGSFTNEQSEAQNITSTEEEQKRKGLLKQAYKSIKHSSMLKSTRNVIIPGNRGQKIKNNSFSDTAHLDEKELRDFIANKAKRIADDIAHSKPRPQSTNLDERNKWRENWETKLNNLGNYNRKGLESKTPHDLESINAQLNDIQKEFDSFKNQLPNLKNPKQGR